MSRFTYILLTFCAQRFSSTNFSSSVMMDFISPCELICFVLNIYTSIRTCTILVTLACRSCSVIAFDHLNLRIFSLFIIHLSPSFIFILRNCRLVVVCVILCNHLCVACVVQDWCGLGCGAPMLPLPLCSLSWTLTASVTNIGWNPCWSASPRWGCPGTHPRRSSNNNDVYVT